MQIKILNVGPLETKQGPKSQYKVFKLDFAVDGQARNRNIMQFSRAIFPVLKAAQPNEYYEITVVKNGEYWDWTEAKKVEGVTEPSGAATSKPQSGSGSTWETPEERAATQVMIVRQSSIRAAVNLLSHSEPGFTAEEAIAVAKKFEAYVLTMNPVEQQDDLDDSHEVM
jgi:hypothetical protein